MKAAKTYFSFPSSENAFELYGVLPKTHLRYETRDFSAGSIYLKAHDYIFDNFPILDTQVKKGDRNAVKVAVRLWTIAEEDFAEGLCDVLYGLVRADPEMFLEEFSHFPGNYQEMVDVLRQVLSRGVTLDTGKPFKAEDVLEELEARARALENIESDDLLVIKLRSEAISLIKSDIQMINAERVLRPKGANSLEVFLHSPKISERRAAYLDILKNQQQYIDQIKLGLEAFERTKEKRIDILKRYIYLAAIIRSDRFIEPLVTVFKDYEDLGGECIYCCPITFALSLYAAFTNWSPPPEIMTKTTDLILTDLRSAVQRIVRMKSKPLVKEPYRIEFADPEEQKWFEGLELLPVEELIKKTGPENTDSSERYLGALALSGKVIDDRNLTELYWLAIEELTHDASGFYRCCVYHAIERAETAKAQKK
jgi:hypothetical protein